MLRPLLNRQWTDTDTGLILQSNLNLTFNHNLRYMYLPRLQISDDILAVAPLLTQVSSSLNHLKLSILLDDDEFERRPLWVALSETLSVAEFTQLGILECHIELAYFTPLRGDDLANYMERDVQECRNHLREFDEMGLLRVVIEEPSDLRG